MTSKSPVRWGILSTANIARSSFLPAVRAADDAAAVAVASRDLERGRRWAEEHGVESAVGSYGQLLEDESIEAVYIALPNAFHARWTVAALEAGKAVLCEKPLCVSPEETQEVLEVARRTGSLLWEAFVFPFRPQTVRLHTEIESGRLGEIREIQSNFHFRISNPQNIRLRPELGGGALNDVGCYPVHLAGQMFGRVPERGTAVSHWTSTGVDMETQGILGYPGNGRLTFSCGMDRPFDTFTRVLGTEGEVRLTNPFHPRPGDVMEIITAQGTEHVPVTDRDPSFTNCVRHINAVIRGRETPRHLAIDDALGTAIGLQLARQSATTHLEQDYQA